MDQLQRCACEKNNMVHVSNLHTTCSGCSYPSLCLPCVLLLLRKRMTANQRFVERRLSSVLVTKTTKLHTK